MIYINSGNWVSVGDKVWARLYMGNGNKPKLVHGEITAIESPPPYVTLKTKRGNKEYRLPANVLHLTKPKATVVEDDLGQLTIWEG